MEFFYANNEKSETNLSNVNCNYRYWFSSEGHPHPFLLSPYLNSRLPVMAKGRCHTYGEILPRILSPLASEGVRSLPSFLAVVLLHYGLLSPSDLAYFLGLNLTAVDVALSRNTSLFRRIPLPKKIGDAASCVAITSKRARLHEFIKREPLPVLYCGSPSKRLVSHEYSLSLSCLLLSLGLPPDGSRSILFRREVSLGNACDSPAKRGAEITMDCLCEVQINFTGKSDRLICLEQDMGTENFRVLARKFYDYAQTDYFTPRACATTSILFSHNAVIPSCAVRPGFRAAHLHALALLIRDFHETMLQGRPDLRDAASLLVRFNSFRSRILNSGRGAEYASAALSRLTGKTGMPDMVFSEAFTDLLSSGEPYDGAFRFLTDALTRGLSSTPVSTESLLVHTALLLKEKDAGLLRILSGEAQKLAARRRLLGLSLTLTKICLRESSFLDAGCVGLTPENSYQFLSPLVRGYQVYFVPTALLSNCVPYLFWNAESTEARRVRDAIIKSLGGREQFTSFSYRPLSEGISLDETSPFPLLFIRNEFRVLDDGGDTVTFCVENASADAGALVRSLLFCRHLSDVRPIQLVLLVETREEILSFLSNFLGEKLNGSFLKSRLAMKSSQKIANEFYYINENERNLNFDNSLTIDKFSSHVLFFEISNSIFTDDNLYCVTKNGKIIPVRF